jgi:putative methyltransferase (TIGR04325 family)
LLREGTKLIDYGGSIGLSYYSYTRRRQLPPHARWIVVEVPQLVATGQKVALQQHAEQLEFVSDLGSTPESDILLSAGALQYIEDSVPGFLEKLPALPQHVLLNKVPLTKAQSYWTLQNFYTGISPYRVYNEKEFLSYFENLGYAVRDSWKVPDLSCDVPFHPRRSVPEFSGFYLERT